MRAFQPVLQSQGLPSESTENVCLGLGASARGGLGRADAGGGGGLESPPLMVLQAEASPWGSLRTHIKILLCPKTSGQSQWSGKRNTFTTSVWVEPRFPVRFLPATWCTRMGTSPSLW